MKNKLLFCFLILLVFFGGINLYSQSSIDTTFTTIMKFDGKSHKVYVKFFENKKYYEQSYFILKVDNIEILDSLGSDIFEVKVIDMNKEDSFDEIMLIKYIDEETDASIFRFEGDKITKLGEIYTNDEFGISGDGKIKARDWMGFWYCDFEFMYNESERKFEKVVKDIYEVKTYVEEEGGKLDITVIEPFKVFEEKKDDSKVKFEVKKGDIINIKQAYIKTDCPPEENYMCHWYLIQNSKGEKGWVRLKNFFEKVEGIPWAS